MTKKIKLKMEILKLNIRRGDALSEFQNFDNFGNSMMTLFRCATGENWYSIMFDTMQDSSK